MQTTGTTNTAALIPFPDARIVRHIVEGQPVDAAWSRPLFRRGDRVRLKGELGKEGVITDGRGNFGFKKTWCYYVLLDSGAMRLAYEENLERVETKTVTGSAA